MRLQLQALWPLTVGMLAFAIFTLYVYVHCERHYRLKLVLLPALLVLVAVSYQWFGSRLGYGYPAAVPKSFEYIAHRLIVEDRRKVWIDVLLVNRAPLSRDPRLHRMQWSQQLETALRWAQQMQQSGGGWIEMDRIEGSDDEPHWLPRRVLPQFIVPKDALPLPSLPQEPQGAPAPHT
jgi:hypothetical protein